MLLGKPCLRQPTLPIPLNPLSSFRRRIPLPLPSFLGFLHPQVLTDSPRSPLDAPGLPLTLYRIERLTREMTPEERHRLRQEHAPAIWESIRLKAQELKPKLLPKSTLGKAVSYFLSEYCGSVEAFWLGSTMRLEGWISALSRARLR